MAICHFFYKIKFALFSKFQDFVNTLMYICMYVFPDTVTILERKATLPQGYTYWDPIKLTKVSKLLRSISTM